MPDLISFFERPRALTLGDIVAMTGAIPAPDVDLLRSVSGVAPLDLAGVCDLTFLDSARYSSNAAITRAAACLVSRKLTGVVLPSGTAVLSTSDPHRCMAIVSGAMYPSALRPGSTFGGSGVNAGSSVHPDARLEANVTVDPGAVIGALAEIGAGTTIAANTVIGPNVRIGRDCWIGSGVSVTHAVIGNRVLIHSGVRIGQDGFGFAMSGQGHLKVPQLGRVVIQDDVEIGANSCVDRGSNRDTVIGEGTKIDNLVHIAHNVVVGRHCVIAAMVGISGSTTIEDFVVFGGQVGVTGHVRVGSGSQIAGSSNVMTDVPKGSRWGGTPAKPMRQWFREIATLKSLVKRGKSSLDVE